MYCGVELWSCGARGPRSVSQPDREDNEEDREERNQDVENENRGEDPGERLRPQPGQDGGEFRPDLEEGVRALVHLTDNSKVRPGFS